MISDFGTSKNVHQSLAKTLTGTTEWISPEIYRTHYWNKGKTMPQGYDGKKADSRFGCHCVDLLILVWSLGCILFELLTLQRPYSEMKDPSDIILKKIRPPLEPYLKPSPNSVHVPEQLQQYPKWQQLVRLFEWCTMPEPHQRPSAKEVLDACETVEKGGNIEFKREVEGSLEDMIDKLKLDLLEAVKKNDFPNVDKILQQIKSLESKKEEQA